MNLDDLKAELAAHHVDVPQRRMLAELAVETLREGLAQLARLGHALHIEKLGEAPVLLWPKMLYRNASDIMTVDNKADFEAALAAGWREHPTDASVKLGPRPNGEVAAPAMAPAPPSPVEHPDMPWGLEPAGTA